jgi:hypothetical protein
LRAIFSISVIRFPFQYCNLFRRESTNFSSPNNSVPINSVETTNPTLVLRVARNFSITEQIGLNAEFNLIATTDGHRNTLISGDPISLDPALGLEANYDDFVFVRAGVSQLQRIQDFDQIERLNSRPALGLGLKVGKLFVDYAYTDLGEDDGRSTYSHIVSVRLGIQPRNQ